MWQTTAATKGLLAAKACARPWLGPPPQRLLEVRRSMASAKLVPAGTAESAPEVWPCWGMRPVGGTPSGVTWP